jgi:fibrillarin-like pre-rRNA processing protein
MQNTSIQGVYKKQGKLFTENLDCCKGVKVYNEKLISYKNKEFRSWNPYRSKLAAAILKGLKFDIKSNSSVLYLGAATGTTVSHISDIVKNGMVYAIENSPISIKSLLEMSKKRPNVIPLLSDGNHPEKYSSIVSSVDIIYQDISQRNQAAIFTENVSKFLKKEGIGILMVKARSIDVSMKPEKAYEIVSEELKEKNLKIIDIVDLSSFEKDHAAFVISF